MFWKEFVRGRQPRRAWLRIVGLGEFDARVNGRRLAETGMNQPWSQYEKTIYYREFDITDLVGRGTNCVGVMLGNSFWNNPNPSPGRYNKQGPQREADEPFLLRAEVSFESMSGSARSVGTDETWRTAEGPVVFSHIYAGEGAFNWTVEWGAAAVLVPWQHYVWFGDRQILKDNFDMMRRFTDFVGKEARDGIAPGGLGDWYDYGHGQRPGASRFTPTDLSATATWALCAQAVSHAAEALGRAEEARTYHELQPGSPPISGGAFRTRQRAGCGTMAAPNALMRWPCAPGSLRRRTARCWLRTLLPTWKSGAGSKRPAISAMPILYERWPRPGVRTFCTGSILAPDWAAMAEFWPRG